MAPGHGFVAKTLSLCWPDMDGPNRAAPGKVDYNCYIIYTVKKRTGGVSEAYRSVYQAMRPGLFS